MAHCRMYLRGLDICVTVLLLVSGLLMIGVGFSSIEGNIPVAKLFEQLSTSDGLLVLQVFGPITVALSIVGVCAASLDRKPLLLLFSALILVEFVAVMVVASPLVQVQAQMDGAVDEVFLNVTPLHQADLYIQTELKKLQASDSCCGLRSYQDWEKQVPSSCQCWSGPSDHLQHSRMSSACVPVDRHDDLWSLTAGAAERMHVHAEPCGSILRSYLSFPIKLRIGIISAFATIAMAAIVLSVALGLEQHWRKRPVEEFDRVKYQPKPIMT